MSWEQDLGFFYVARGAQGLGSGASLVPSRRLQEPEHELVVPAWEERGSLPPRNEVESHAWVLPCVSLIHSFSLPKSLCRLLRHTPDRAALLSAGRGRRGEWAGPVRVRGG